MSRDDEDDDRIPPQPPPRRPRRPRYNDEDDEDQIDEPVSTIIPYRNGWALAAYYCGVFGLIPCVGNVLGPIALVLGILGLRRVKTHPAAKGTGHAIAGIVLGGIETVLYWGAVLFLLAAGGLAWLSKLQ